MYNPRPSSPLPLRPSSPGQAILCGRLSQLSREVRRGTSTVQLAATATLRTTSPDSTGRLTLTLWPALTLQLALALRLGNLKPTGTPNLYNPYNPYNLHNTIL